MLRPINLNEDHIQVPEDIWPQNQRLGGAGTAGELQTAPLEESSWIRAYFLDFKKRLLNLLGFEFRHMSCSLAFQFIGEKNQNQGSTEAQEDQTLIDQISKTDLERHISFFDLKRLDSYAKNMVDFHLVMDLVPILAKLFFTKTTVPRGTINLSYVQSAILIGMGL